MMQVKDLPRNASQTQMMSAIQATLEPKYGNSWSTQLDTIIAHSADLHQSLGRPVHDVRARRPKSPETP